MMPPRERTRYRWIESRRIVIAVRKVCKSLAVEIVEIGSKIGTKSHAENTGLGSSQDESKNVEDLDLLRIYHFIRVRRTSEAAGTRSE